MSELDYSKLDGIEDDRYDISETVAFCDDYLTTLIGRCCGWINDAKNGDPPGWQPDEQGDEFLAWAQDWGHMVNLLLEGHRDMENPKRRIKLVERAEINGTTYEPGTIFGVKDIERKTSATQVSRVLAKLTVLSDLLSEIDAGRAFAARRV